MQIKDEGNETNGKGKDKDANGTNRANLRGLGIDNLPISNINANRGGDLNDTGLSSREMPQCKEQALRLPPGSPGSR